MVEATIDHHNIRFYRQFEKKEGLFDHANYNERMR